MGLKWVTNGANPLLVEQGDLTNLVRLPGESREQTAARFRESVRGMIVGDPRPTERFPSQQGMRNHGLVGFYVEEPGVHDNATPLACSDGRLEEIEK